VFLLLAGAAGMGWWGANRWLQSQSDLPLGQITPLPTQTPSSAQPLSRSQLRPLSSQLQNKTVKTIALAVKLGIQDKFFVNLNQVFWDKYPNQRGTYIAMHLKIPGYEQSGTIAAQLLDQLQPLSPAARRRLGSFIS